MEDKELSDELDSVLMHLGATMKLLDELPAQDIPEREADVLYVHNLLRRLAIGDDIQIFYKIHEPFRDFGYVSIIGESIEFQRMDLVADAFAHADNMEVYSRTDKKIQINLGFQGLSKTLPHK